MRYVPCITLSLLTLALAPAAVAADRVEPRTAEAVIAADDAWSAAEERGDADFVDRLLLPDYVSIAPNGQVHTKAAIVAGARKRAALAPGVTAAKNAEWRAAHPFKSEVKMFGDTAVISFVSTKDGSVGAVNSSDIFVYRDGRWHAIYSQHSTSGS